MPNNIIIPSIESTTLSKESLDMILAGNVWKASEWSTWQSLTNTWPQLPMPNLIPPLPLPFLPSP